MDCEFYLIFARKARHWNGMNVRLAHKKPALEPGEVPIKVSASLPDALFARPQLNATIKITDDKVTAPVVSAEITQNIEKIVGEALGIDLKISPARGRK